MIRLLLIALTATLTVTATATNKFKVSPCTAAQQGELDESALDFIKSNNFSENTIYTVTQLNAEQSKYSPVVGMAHLVFSKSTLSLLGLEFCSKMESPRLALDEISLSNLLKSRKTEVIDISGAYLQSDEHVALDGSTLNLKVVGKEGSRTVIEAKIKLIVASLTDDKNADAEDGKLKPTDILEGKFYLAVSGGK